MITESARSHRDRDRDNQRESRHTVKEEYPELQYRSPLVRPGPSSKETNVFVFNHSFELEIVGEKSMLRNHKKCKLSSTLLFFIHFKYFRIIHSFKSLKVYSFF